MDKSLPLSILAVQLETCKSYEYGMKIELDENRMLTEYVIWTEISVLILSN